MEKYITLDKKVGETPLSCAEAYRATHPELIGVPMAYAGRLDPMASGKLLVLLGDECKNQENYHSLDKEYEFSVLFGIESDSLDVLGRLTPSPQKDSDVLTEDLLKTIGENFVGDIELPYPKFSAKTVQGKPLHMWTLENRLDEISIPTKKSKIFELEFIKLEKISREKLVNEALEKVNSIPPVTEARKALGNDFRRVDVRADWQNILENDNLPAHYQIAHFRCVASSGTYMRTLASEIAKKLDATGLAWHIHRTRVGEFNKNHSSWTRKY